MLKITPVKQQTGARFYPGDISRPGAFGAEGRATERLAGAWSGAADLFAKLWKEKQTLEKNAHRQYTDGMVLKDIQYAYKNALTKAQPDGSDLHEIFEREIAGSKLDKYLEDSDDTEKKHLTGLIEKRVAAGRASLMQHYIKNQLQMTEINVTKQVNNKRNDIRDVGTLRDYIKMGEEFGEGLDSNSIVGQATERIKNTIVRDGVTKWFELRVRKIRDDAPLDGEIPNQQVFTDLKVVARPHLQFSDLSDGDIRYLAGKLNLATEKKGKPIAAAELRKTVTKQLPKWITGHPSVRKEWNEYIE